MRGHEYIRDALRAYLETAVPLFLTAHLTDIGEAEPVPADVSFVLADSLQDVVETEDIAPYPVVAVRSTDGDVEQKTGITSWTFLYDLEVMVAVDHRTYGAEGYKAATRSRDRLLLAVRSALLSVSGLDSGEADGDVEFLPGKRREQTGRGNQQSLSGVALAVGTLSFRARVTERLSVPPALEQIGAVDLSVSGVDASQTL